MESQAEHSPRGGARGPGGASGLRRAARRCARASVAASALLAVVACAPEGLVDGRAWTAPGELTLVGDRFFRVEAGARLDLKVRYHDDQGEPLAGVVEFAIDGEAPGAELSDRAATTDSSGRAQVTLDLSGVAQGSFRVEASALDAGAVAWEITVEEGEPPLDPSGAYRIESGFGVAQAQEGALGDAIVAVLDLTQRPGDALLDRAAYLGWISPEEAAAASADFATFLESEAAEPLAQLAAAGDEFEEASRGFGAVSELRVSGDPLAPAAEHELASLVLTFGGEEHALTLAELGVESAEPQSVSLSLSGAEAQVTLAEHAVPLPYGTMLQEALDRIAGSAPGEGATDLEAVFRAVFNQPSFACDPAVVDWLSIRFGLSPIPAESACIESINAAAERLSQIEAIPGAAGQLVIAGEARLVDDDGDGVADALADGAWTGTVEHEGEPTAPLDAETSAFTAEKIDTQVY